MTGFRYFDFDGTERTITLTTRCHGVGEIEVICDGKSVGKVTLCEAAKWQKRQTTCNYQYQTPSYFHLSIPVEYDFEIFILSGASQRISFPYTFPRACQKAADSGNIDENKKCMF